MKYLASFVIVFFLIHTVNVYGAACTDPGGCSMVSYAFSTHTIGLIQFGNTTGKIFLKKTKLLCDVVIDNATGTRIGWSNFCINI